MALVQLLTEHPELPRASWRITESALEGHLYGPAVGYFDGLTAYAEVVGGGILPVREYASDGQTLRLHELSTVWRDVPVVIGVGVPVNAAVAA